MHLQIEKAVLERNQAVARFDQSESLWEAKLKEKQKEVDSAVHRAEQSNQDREDALIQVDKLVKRVKQVQSEQERDEIEAKDVSKKLQQALDQSKTLFDDNIQLKK